MGLGPFVEETKRRYALTAVQDGSSEMKCWYCHGNGEKCLAGCSAHPNNWYTCEVCGGSGKLPIPEDMLEQAAQEASAMSAAL